MRVRDMIARLEEFHPDLDVCIKAEDTGHAIPEPEIFVGSAKEHPALFVAIQAQYIGEDWGPCAEEGDYDA